MLSSFFFFFLPERTMNEHLQYVHIMKPQLQNKQVNKRATILPCALVLYFTFPLSAIAFRSSPESSSQRYAECECGKKNNTPKQGQTSTLSNKVLLQMV